jgi:aspartyl-tRNA(Asn)/glutamyl-tRNA(Gln) amidotransferase subunit C
MKREDIEHLAKLSRIELRGGEADVLAENITSILNYVSEIQEITGGEDLVKQVGPVHNVFREDENPREPGVFTETLLAAAPERDGQYFKVKKILGATE